jgi:hypothetical protein
MIPRQGGALGIILPLLGAALLSRFGSSTYAGGLRTVNICAVTFLLSATTADDYDVVIAVVVTYPSPLTPNCMRICCSTDDQTLQHRR